MLFGSFIHPPSHPFGNADINLKVKEQRGMRGAGRERSGANEEVMM